MFIFFVPAAALLGAMLFDGSSSSAELEAQEKMIEREFLRSAKMAYRDLTSTEEAGGGAGTQERVSGINDVPGLETTVAMYYMMLDPAVPWAQKKIIIAALAYFVSPVDAAPGWIDDLGVAYGAYVAVKGSMTEVHRAQARSFIARLERSRRDAMAPSGPAEIQEGVEPEAPLRTMAEAEVVRRGKKKSKTTEVPQGDQAVEYGMEMEDEDEVEAIEAFGLESDEVSDVLYDAATQLYEHPVKASSYLTGTWPWALGGDPLPEGWKVRVTAEGGALQYEPGSKLSPGKWFVVLERVPGSVRLKKPLVISKDEATTNGLGDAPWFELRYNAKNKAFVWVYNSGEMSPEACVEEDGGIFPPRGPFDSKAKKNQILVD